MVVCKCLCCGFVRAVNVNWKIVALVETCCAVVPVIVHPCYVFMFVSSYGISVVTVNAFCVNDGKSCVLHAYDSVHILSILPVQPIGQLLNLHFQIVSLSLHRTRTMMLSTLGCVNWYASIHFAMSLSGIAW